MKEKPQNMFNLRTPINKIAVVKYIFRNTFLAEIKPTQVGQTPTERKKTLVVKKRLQVMKFARF